VYSFAASSAWLSNQRKVLIFCILAPFSLIRTILV
jgi:predicted membrane chloride channel (bestrophin family)